MDMPLTTIDQMRYLFMFDKLHPNSQPDEVIEEIMKLHEQYMKSDEWIKALEMEKEIYIYTTKINKARKEGKKKELFQNVQLVIMSLYQKDASE